MKAKLGMKKSGAGDRMKILTFMMLSVVLAMAWVFVQIGNQVEVDRARFMAASEQMVLSQSLAKYALAAASGDTDAFAQLASSRDRFTEITKTQMSEFGEASGKTGTPEYYALADLDSRWRDFRDSINAVLEGQSLIMATAEATSLMNEAMPQLMKHTRAIADTLVKNGASAAQVQLASQQAVLAQRILISLNGVLRGDGVESAFASLGEDVREFGRVLDGFERGTGGIKALQGESLQSNAGDIAVLFKPVRDKVGAIVEKSAGLVAIQAAVAGIGGQSETLFSTVQHLNVVLDSIPENRFVNTELAYILGAVALLILFWMAFETLRSQRLRSRHAEEENARNQQAIMGLLDEMGDLAEGDLTVHATVSEDFTGSIADSINVTVDSLRGLVKTINDTSSQLSSSVQETEDIAGRLLTASKQQSRNITAASSAINEMSDSMNEVSGNASESSKVAMRSVEIARNGGEAVQRTMKGMDTIREHIQETSKRIKRLGESSQEIGDIVELINDIAEQTNILALNASIQAAMAGEAGRGFAVVADEVQRLAERSANATRQIDVLVKTIQADTNEAVISMEKSTAGVVKGAQLAEDASSSLEEIESISDQLAGLIQNISNSARNQAEAASDLTATMQGIQEITTQATSGTEQTSRSIRNLSRLAQDLDTSVAGFKLPQ